MKRAAAVLAGLFVTIAAARCTEPASGDADDGAADDGDPDGTDRGGRGGDGRAGGGGKGGPTGAAGSAAGGRGGQQSTSATGGSPAPMDAGATGGSGGTFIDAGAPETATPPAIPDGPGVFFSGKETTVRKLVATDDKPGNAYAADSGRAVALEAKPVSDPALPANTKYALYIDLPKPGAVNLMVGFNFRRDELANEWGWLDASGYEGFEYWVKSNWPVLSFQATTVEAVNLPITPTGGGQKGVCGGATACQPIHQTQVQAVRDSWSRKRYRWSDFRARQGAMHDLTKLGRIDLIHSIKLGDPPLGLWITGVRLLAKEDFAP